MKTSTTIDAVIGMNSHRPPQREFKANMQPVRTDMLIAGKYRLIAGKYRTS